MSNTNSPERPRAEPEILPPDHSRPRSERRLKDLNETGGMHRIYVAKLGPVGGGLLMLAIVLLAVVLLIVLLGTMLIWIPLVALIAVVAVLTGLLRGRRS